MRDSTSVGPPAGNRLMYRTGLFGQASAARATLEATIGAARAPPDRMSARRRDTNLFNAYSLTTTTSLHTGRDPTRTMVEGAATNRDTSPCPTVTIWEAPGASR